MGKSKEKTTQARRARLAELQLAYEKLQKKSRRLNQQRERLEASKELIRKNLERLQLADSLLDLPLYQALQRLDAKK